MSIQEKIVYTIMNYFWQADMKNFEALMACFRENAKLDFIGNLIVVLPPINEAHT